MLIWVYQILTCLTEVQGKSYTLRTEYNRAHNIAGSYFHHTDSSCNLGPFLLTSAFKTEARERGRLRCVAPWVAEPGARAQRPPCKSALLLQRGEAGHPRAGFKPVWEAEYHPGVITLCLFQRWTRLFMQDYSQVYSVLGGAVRRLIKHKKTITTNTVVLPYCTVLVPNPQATVFFPPTCHHSDKLFINSPQLKI